MATKPHPDFEEIKRAIKSLSKKGKAFSNVCYRCTEPQFVDQIISGVGSELHGARWNPKNSFPTVYLCETAEAALQEYLARGRRMKIPDHRSLPMVMVGIKVRVLDMLNTTDPDIAPIIEPILKKDRIHWRTIQDRREAASQAVGRAISEVFFSGLIAPSQVLQGAKNIVLFPKNLKAHEEISAPDVRPMPY